MSQVDCGSWQLHHMHAALCGLQRACADVRRQLTAQQLALEVLTNMTCSDGERRHMTCSDSEGCVA